MTKNRTYCIKLVFLDTSTTIPGGFKSQLSLETAEADAQISQLLESLQKDSKNKMANLSVDSEKMSELFNSLTGGDDNSCSSPPPSISKATTTNAGMASTSAQSAMPSLNSLTTTTSTTLVSLFVKT